MFSRKAVRDFPVRAVTIRYIRARARALTSGGIFLFLSPPDKIPRRYLGLLRRQNFVNSLTSLGFSD